MDLVIATNNTHKLVEIQDILCGIFENIYTLTQLGIDVSIEETGKTLEENALIKARFVKGLTPLCVLADDTGLCVEALGGAPGVYSARYAGEGHDFAENRKKLLSALISEENRKAYFATCVALILENGEEITAVGKHEGQILREEIGENGFGYDNVFYSEELKKSFAQASLQEKDKVSHRARALYSLIEKIKERI